MSPIPGVVPGHCVPPVGRVAASHEQADNVAVAGVAPVQVI